MKKFLKGPWGPKISTPGWIVLIVGGWVSGSLPFPQWIFFSLVVAIVVTIVDEYLYTKK